MRAAGHDVVYVAENQASATDQEVAARATAEDRIVVTQDYDFGEMKTVDGLADFGTAKAAWFKDSEGNILELSEVL